ncbi:hypothetical protein FDG96_gp06 [Bacillus phage Mgbh1]|uniref:Uncharacterized protein n=1 Tax=Bacillus phage Mgbh1 TaxID=1796993 RepID=A0A142F1K8_9CAUD|nr:hypothetical protein FDG96_gp06 [Bacillus phage Mgbh1]AMQ66665.1 hypothetical protein [Bacillus phage Mgbh1]
MRKYIIDFHTGVRHAVNINTLEEAQEFALSCLAYTGEKITIIDDRNNVVSVARWWAHEPNEDDDVLVQFGSFGFYETWSDI